MRLLMSTLRIVQWRGNRSQSALRKPGKCRPLGPSVCFAIVCVGWTSGCAMAPMNPFAASTMTYPPQAAVAPPRNAYSAQPQPWTGQSPHQPLPSEYAQAKTAYDVMPAAYEEQVKPSYLEHGPAVAGRELTPRPKTATEIALELKAKLEELEVEHELAETENKALKTRLEATEKTLASVGQQNERLTSEYRAAKEQVSELRGEMASLKTDLGRINEQIRGEGEKSMQEFDRLLDELQGAVLELALQHAGDDSDNAAAK